MNEGYSTEPTIVESVPSEFVTLPTEGTDSTQTDVSVPESTQGSVYENLSGSINQQTEALIVIIEDVGSNMVHANLFSGFLVCGTLIGLALLRKIYGT